MQRLPSLNWHKPGETKRSSRLEAPEGLITDGLQWRICPGKVAEGEVFPSHWQGIGSLHKRPVKLILTKPQGSEWSAYAIVFITDACALLLGGMVLRRRAYSFIGRMSNRYSKLCRCNVITYALVPSSRKVESCARRAEYKWARAEDEPDRSRARVIRRGEKWYGTP